MITINIFYVYALSSEYDNSIYVGMSQDVGRCLVEHNRGQVQSTRSKRPFRVVYKKEFCSRIDARRHEKYIKSGFGRKFIKRKIEQGL